MKTEILLFFCGVLFLCASCGGTKKVQKNTSKDISTTTTTVTTTTETKPPKPKTNSPVYIDGGPRKKTFYVGMPNTIKVYVEGGSTEHLDVSVSGGKLLAGDLSKGLYSYTEKYDGMAIEVVARDTTNGVVITEIFDVVQIPAPDAYIWTYRKMMKGNQSEFTATSFKEQNAVILQHSERIPARCNATSYTMIHINAEGKRITHENEGKNGLFDETTKAIVSNVETGDIVVIENIKTACTPLPIKNIVYVIK